MTIRLGDTSMTTEQPCSFEEWCESQKVDHYSKHENGDYALLTVRCMEAGWNARLASLLAEIQSPELVEACAAAIFDVEPKFDRPDDYYALPDSMKCIRRREAQSAISVIVKKLKGEK